jgi:hypothetical protein
MAIEDKNIAQPEFWLNIAAESIYNSPGKRKESVDTLQKIILWAFAIFASGGFAMTVFGDVKNYNKLALCSFGIGYFLLTISYAVSNEALYPVLKTYRPNDPVDIEDKFSESVVLQTKKFKRAAMISIVGFFALAVGILIQFGNVHKDEVKGKPVAFALNAIVVRQGDSLFIPVVAGGKKGGTIKLSFIPFRMDKKDAIIEGQSLYDGVFLADTAGLLNYSYIPPRDSTIKYITIRSIVAEKNVKDTTIERIYSVRLSLK